MDDKILFYIILGVIYFLFSRLKKKKPSDEPDSESSEEPQPQNGKRPITFEELLREISEAKQPAPPPPVLARKEEYNEYKPQPDYPVYEDYDDNIEEEAKSLEKTSIDDDRSNKVYEDAKKLAFYRPTLEETLKLSDVNTEFSKFKEFETKTEEKVLPEYLKQLRDPKGLKRALVLSEVLNRKHF